MCGSLLVVDIWCRINTSLERATSLTNHQSGRTDVSLNRQQYAVVSETVICAVGS